MEVASATLRNTYKENKRVRGSAYLLTYTFLFFKLSLGFGLDFEFGLGLRLTLELESVMQMASQKIGKLFINMLSTSRGRTPHSPSHKIAYIINDANVVEKSPRAVTKIV